MVLEKYKAEAVTFSRKLLPKIIIPVCKQPQSTLKDQCRVVVRNHLLTLHPHQPLFDRLQELTLPRMICDYWWLIRATYVVDGRFFCHFFWKVVGTVRTHISHIQQLYTVINVHGNMQGGGTKPNIGKLGKFWNLLIAIKVAGSIGSHIGSVMVAILNY